MKNNHNESKSPLRINGNSAEEVVSTICTNKKLEADQVAYVKNNENSFEAAVKKDGVVICQLVGSNVGNNVWEVYGAESYDENE